MAYFSRPATIENDRTIEFVWRNKGKVHTLCTANAALLVRESMQLRALVDETMKHRPYRITVQAERVGIQTYVAWLHGQGINRDASALTLAQFLNDLLAAHNAGIELGASSKFLDTVLDKIAGIMHALKSVERSIVTEDCIVALATCYSHEHTDPALRRFVVDWIVWGEYDLPVATYRHGEYLLGADNNELNTQVCNAFLLQKRGAPNPLLDRCSYHQHREIGERCYADEPEVREVEQVGASREGAAGAAEQEEEDTMMKEAGGEGEGESFAAPVLRMELPFRMH